MRTVLFSFLSPINQAQRCKGRKIKGEDELQRRGGRMSRKGYWRQIQKEAGSRTRRQTDKKKRAEREHSREKRGGGRAVASVSYLWLHAFKQSNFHPEGTQQCL